MPFGRHKIDQPPVCQQVETAPVLEHEFLNERSWLRRGNSLFAQGRKVNLDIEVTRVRDQCTVFHLLEVLSTQDLLPTRGSAEDVSQRCRLLGRHHAKTVHRSLKGPQRIDLEHDHMCAHASGALGDSTPAPAIPNHDKVTTGQQYVRGAQNAIDRRLARAIAIVKEVLRLRLVDRDDRDTKHALDLHGPQAKDARRRLLRASDQRVEQLATRRMNDTNQIGTIVHRQLWAMIDGGHDVPVVRVVIFAVDRKDRDVVSTNERRRDRILRRERIRRAQHDLGATRLERAHQIGCLGRNVEARTDAEPSERLLLLKTSANLAQYRHVAICPVDQAAALLRERQILDVMGNAGH